MLDNILLIILILLIVGIYPNKRGAEIDDRF